METYAIVIYDSKDSNYSVILAKGLDLATARIEAIAFNKAYAVYLENTTKYITIEG